MSLRSSFAWVISWLALVSNPAMGAENQNPILQAGISNAQSVCYAVKATVAKLSGLKCGKGNLVVVPLASIERWNGTSQEVTQIQTIFTWDEYAIQVPVATQTVSYREDGEPLGSCLQPAKTPPLDTYNQSSSHYQIN